MNENKKLKELVDKQLNDALSDKGKISKDNIKLKDENDELRSSNKHLNNELQ